MNNSLLFLISICLTVLLLQSCPTASWKIRHWKGLLLLSKDKCENRCKFKHGYFTDAAGKYQLAAKAKRGIVPGKCQCMVSPALRKYITQKYSLKEANYYGRLNFFGMTKRARNRLVTLGGKVEFITYEQLVAKKKAAEYERVIAANRAAAAARSASNSNPGSGSTTPALSGACNHGRQGSSGLYPGCRLCEELAERLKNP